MTETSPDGATGRLEALPIVVAGAAALLYGPSLGLSLTFGLLGLAIAVYAFFLGVRAWVAALGLLVNAPFAVAAAYILLSG